LTLTPPENDSPDYWDWRDVGVESEVRDQGSCNSDWAMSVVGAMEAANMIKFNKTESYSPQQLLDCSQDYDTYGCNGGMAANAFEYLYFFGGITTED